MRLIDADALKEEVNKKNVVGRFNTIILIDNAPSVNPCENCDLISREALKKEIERTFDMQDLYLPVHFLDLIDNAPTVDIKDQIAGAYNEGYACGGRESKRPQGEFSRKDLESWLYQIAMNNIGTDFEKSVVEIIHRLDGFERFVSEQKGGAV